MNHPPFSLLIDFIAGRLTPEAQGEVEAHLTTCTDCQHSHALARQLASARHSPMERSSAGLLRRAVVAFRRQQQQATQRIQRVATLLADNRTQVAAQGVRGIAQARQMLYTVDEFDLDLQVDVAEHTFVLQGQLLAQNLTQAELEGLTIRLVGSDFSSSLRLTDELGRFAISDLIPDVYSLHVVLADRDVNIEPLVLPGETVYSSR